MCAPLLDGKQGVLGVVHVDKRGGGAPFREKDLQMLVALSPLLSVALRFAQLHQQALKQQAFEQELAAAHRVQLGLLPQQPPTIPGYEFFSFYSAAREVGGDYYDYIALPDGRLALAVADAAGKGAGAALQVASVSGGLKALLTSMPNLPQAVSHLNRQLCEGPTEGQFVTLALLVLDPLRHEVELLSAGHERPLWRRPTGELSEFDGECGGLPLGVSADATYRTMRLVLGAGDMLLMYTDGVSDAQNSGREFFEAARIRALFSAHGEGIGELGRRVVQEVFDFMGRSPQFDDISLVGLGRVADDQASSKPATANCAVEGIA
jgi:serine phosphatase RsbU (regulator of sigma subunit)